MLSSGKYRVNFTEYIPVQNQPSVLLLISDCNDWHQLVGAGVLTPQGQCNKLNLTKKSKDVKLFKIQKRVIQSVTRCTTKMTLFVNG